MPSVGAVQILPVVGVPEIRTGDDLAARLGVALDELGGLDDGDVLVVSSKVVSKALGLRAVEGTDRDSLVLEHSRRVVAERVTGSGLTRIVEALAGPVIAAAGLDASNTGPEGGVLILPVDPDAAARALHTRLAARLDGTGRAGLRFAVVLSDTAGRPWRAGQTDLSLGSHGLRVLDDLRGEVDADGRSLSVTTRALADEIASAADLVKGKRSAVAAAVVRGLTGHLDDGGDGSRALVRTGPADWFGLGRVEAVRAALGAPPGTPPAQQVGIPAAPPEEDELRGARAVRLALLGQDPPGTRVTGSVGRGYVVHSPDPVLAGRVAARLEVALAGEQLAATVTVHDG